MNAICDECRLILIANPYEVALWPIWVQQHFSDCPNCEEFLYRMIAACQPHRTDAPAPIDREIVRWPVRFILDGSVWQRGYDAALSQADDQPAQEMTNPFDPIRDEFYGFEDGRRDAEKLALTTNRRQP